MSPNIINPQQNATTGGDGDGHAPPTSPPTSTSRLHPLLSTCACAPLALALALRTPCICCGCCWTMRPPKTGGRMQLVSNARALRARLPSLRQRLKSSLQQAH